MEEKLFIVDGSGLLVANYYGTLPPEVMFAKTQEEKEANYDKIAQKDGKYINALYPTIKQILEFCMTLNNKYLAVCFDASRDTFRREIFTDYKANRKSTPQPLKEQFILCEQILEKMGVPVFFSKDYEADDLAGSISKQFNNIKKVLFSKDKDYYQLIDKDTDLWMMYSKKDVADNLIEKYNLLDKYETIPNKVVPYSYDVFVKEYKINPLEFINVLALGGDSADNIPGVKGVSTETAFKLIRKYKNLNNLYEEIENTSITEQDIKKDWKENLDIKRAPINPLINDKENAYLSLELATIKTNINLNDISPVFTLKKLEITGYFKDVLDNNMELTSKIRKDIREKIEEYL